MLQGMIMLLNAGQHQLRDSIRIHALEELNWRTVVLAVSMKDGDGFQTNHLQQNWTCKTFLKKLAKMKITFDIIELDHYWMPEAYVSDKIPVSFFSEKLTELSDSSGLVGQCFYQLRFAFWTTLCRPKKNGIQFTSYTCLMRRHVIRSVPCLLPTKSYSSWENRSLILPFPRTANRTLGLTVP